VAGLKDFRRSNLFLAIFVCRMIFASFYQEKEEGHFAFSFLSVLNPYKQY